MAVGWFVLQMIQNNIRNSRSSSLDEFDIDQLEDKTKMCSNYDKEFYCTKRCRYCSFFEKIDE